MPEATPHLALVATNDDKMAHLLHDMLSQVGFIVKTIKRSTSKNETINNYVLLVLDGDPINPIDGINPAVIVISPTDDVAAYDSGADLVLHKPLDANIFIARVRSILRRYGIKI